MTRRLYTAPELNELRTTARELRGCGSTVQEITHAMQLSQAEVIDLLDLKREGRN